MYELQIIDTTVPENKPNIITSRIYKDLHNAISDVITNNLGCTLEGTKTDSPWFLRAGGEMPNGYVDDFQFVYTSGIRICIGKLFIQDEEA